MPISYEESMNNKRKALEVRDSKGQLVDYKNPYPEGSTAAEFFDELSFEGKNTLLYNNYAWQSLSSVLQFKDLDWAKENVGTLLGAKPPENTDIYADAKQQGKGEVGNFDLFELAPLVLSVFAPGLGTTIGSALGATGTTASVLGSGIVGGTLSAAQGESFAKGALTGAIGAGAGSVLKDVGAGVSEAVGGGTIGDIASGAVTGAAKSALAGGDVLSGALSGGISGGLPSISPEIKDAFGGGITGDVASGLLTGAASAAISGKDIGTGALTGALKGLGTTTPTQALDYGYADDAAQLAEQGLSASQIADILGAADAPPDVADSLANYAINALDIGLQGEDVTNYINNEFTFDAQFSAADVAQLFDQGLSNKQVQDVLDATKQGDTLTNLGMDAEFIAADAQQLWNQTNNVGAVEQNLIYSGVDPIVAATVANEVAFGTPTEELTDVILQASDPNTLTTDGTLFTQNPEVDTSGTLKPIKTQAIPQQQQIPTVNAQTSRAAGNVDDSLFLLDRSRYADLGNPFLRTSASYKNIVGNIFGG